MAQHQCMPLYGMVPMHVTLCTSHYGMITMHFTLWQSANSCHIHVVLSLSSDCTVLDGKETALCSVTDVSSIP